MASVSIWNSGAPLLKATVNWGDGNTTDIQQTSYTFGVSTYYNSAWAKVTGLVAPNDGFITNITQPNQTFNGTNQNTNIRFLGVGGITSFDTDLTGLTVLTNLVIGGYYETGLPNGTPGPIIDDPNNIISFTTILPITITFQTVYFINNNVDCQNFNPIWNSQSKVLYFYSNQQITPLTIGGNHQFTSINIYNNYSLSNITLNNLQYVTDASGVLLACYLASNGLSQVSINGLNSNTVSSSFGISINLSSNKFVTFNPSWISSYPPTRMVNIDLSFNSIETFDCLFNGPNMGTLKLNSQSPEYSKLATVTDNSLQTSTFKTIILSNNRIGQCPILPITATKVYLTGNPIIGTGKLGGLIRPNFSPNMEIFELSSSGGNLAILDNWTPNATATDPSNNHTRLQDITTWTYFKITSQTNLTNWIFNFSPNITSTTSTIDLQRNSFGYFDMSFVKGFSIVNLSFQSFGNSLSYIDALTYATKVRELDLSVNYGLTSSSSIILDSDPWPLSLYKLNLLRCKSLSNWTKSFAGFNTNAYSPFNVDFSQQNSGDGLSQTSMEFIIKNLITATTLTNGTLTFTKTNYVWPKLPFATTSNDTKLCLGCLSASTSTPCNPTLSSGNNLTLYGRGFNVGLTWS